MVSTRQGLSDSKIKTNKMKFLKNSLLAIFIGFTLLGCNDQDSNSDFDIDKEKEAVEEVISAYKKGIEALSVEGLNELFYKDSEVFESGGDEGSFKHYLDHHLAPELDMFESFKFDNHRIKVKVEMPFAFTTETYTFKIVVKESGEPIERKGVATSILKKENGKWRIMKTHSSSRGMNSSH